MDPNSFEKLRFQMVERQIAGKGVSDRLVLDAMRRVRREQFVSNKLMGRAYDDTPLPIGDGQTISQPYIVGFMIEALGLQPGNKVLEVGTGSGYAAAILAEIASEVITIERIEQLASNARTTLDQIGNNRIKVFCGDGTKGCPEEAPFDAIIVSAGGPRVPRSLELQLKIGGRLVIPVGPELNKQRLVRVVRESDSKFEKTIISHVRFVPLIGGEGWNIDKEESGDTPKVE